MTIMYIVIMNASVSLRHINIVLSVELCGGRVHAGMTAAYVCARVEARG